MQHDPAAAEFADVLRSDCLGTRVGQLHREISRRYEDALRPVGLSMPQVEILGALVLHDEGARPNELAEILRVGRSTMSRNLAALHARGWVDTAEASPTGRSMSVAITPAGAERLAAARQAWTAVQERTLESLGAGAPRTLDRWLTRLSKGG